MRTAPLTTISINAVSGTPISSASLARMYKTLSSAGLQSNSAIISKHASYGSLLCDEEPLTDVVFDPSAAQISYKMVGVGSTGAVRDVVCYNPNDNTPNREKPTLTLNTTSSCIECGVLGKKVSAIPAECNVDIVLTLPTNHAACTEGNNDGTLVAPNGSTISSTPIVQVATAYAKFLRENFLHTRGTAVALVPYSAKISVPPSKSGWTVAIPPMNQLPTEPYLKQAIAYGTDGYLGGKIVSNAIQYDWGDEDGADSDAVGDPNVGFPIMFRRGPEATYRGTTFYEGADLLSTANPNSDSLKFQRMNPNPCYLGHCNLLANCCETDCPTYLANPYFITELTDDIPNVIHDLGLIRPVNDPKNKSNFLFLAVQWAQMLLFEGWTDHPNAAATNQKFAHPDRSGKKKAIIFVVNSPDRFEPNELTYLGFNNDASEIPMIESDKIDFSYNYGAPTNDVRTSPVKSTKGALVYTGDGTYNTTLGSYVVTSGNGKLTFPQKGILKIVVAASQSPSSCSFTNINNVSQRIEFDKENVASSLTQNTTYSITGTKTFYLTPDQISDVQDADGNYCVNFSLANVRLVSAEITNRPYTKTIPTCSPLSGTTDAWGTTGTAYIITNVEAPITISVERDYASIRFSNVNGSNLAVTGEQTLTVAKTFDFPSANFSNNSTEQKVNYTLRNATVTAATVDSFMVYEFYVKPGRGHFPYEGPGCSNFLNYRGDYWGMANLLHDNESISTFEFGSRSGTLEWSITRRYATDVYGGSPGLRFFINDTEIGYVGREETYSSGGKIGGNLITTVKSARTDDISFFTNVYTIPWNSWSSYNKSTNTFKIKTDHALYSKYDDVKNRFSYFRITGTVPCPYSLAEGIRFAGAANLKVTAAPNIPNGSIAYTTPANASATANITSNQTITISPTTHKYVKQDDNTYKITISLTKVKISDPQLVSTDTIFEYASIDLPETSRTVDFSQKVSEKPAFIGEIAYGESATSLGKAEVKYDACYWVTDDKSSNNTPWISGFNRTFHKNIAGDFYLLVEHMSGSAPSINLFCGASADANNTYNFSGLHRRFLSFDEISPSDYVDFNIGGVPSSVVKYVMAGFTAPINRVLYQYESQTSPNSEPHAAAEVVADVTADACTKLAAAAGSDAKVYVIKYKTTNISLDSCVPAEKIRTYSANSETELNEKLHEIAADIKSFAEYSAHRTEEIP
jgi:hypothetical protein